MSHNWTRNFNKSSKVSRLGF